MFFFFFFVLSIRFPIVFDHLFFPCNPKALRDAIVRKDGLDHIVKFGHLKRPLLKKRKSPRMLEEFWVLLLESFVVLFCCISVGITVDEPRNERNVMSLRHHVGNPQQNLFEVPQTKALDIGTNHGYWFNFFFTRQSLCLILPCS